MVDKVIVFIKDTAPFDFWDYIFLGNQLDLWLVAILAFIVFLIIFKAFQRIVLWRLKNLAKRTKTDIDDMLIRAVETLRPPFYVFVAFWLAIKVLVFNALFERLIDIVLIIWVVWQVIMALQIVFDYAFRRGIGKEEDPGTKSALKMLNTLTKLVLWILGALFILSNLGINVTSLVAGFGIVGIAVALAIQNILSDLFSSFAIFFDKPFVVGDFIIAGEHIGTVEKIGIKTTRLRALQGEEIVVSNKELTSARIQNFKRMADRRVVFFLGVTYKTSIEKLKKIPALIKEIIASSADTRFDRAHFNKFGDSALLFEVVFYVLSPDYNVYMDTLHEINLKIKERFEKEGIEMAYPTQTIYLEK